MAQFGPVVHSAVL